MFLVLFFQLRRLFTLLFPMLLIGIAAPCAAHVREVLIIGNSYTFYDDTDMDRLLQEIARSAGESINVTRAAVASYTLNDHWHRSRTQKTLDSRHWDLVILQEHSLVAGNAKLRKNVMLPAVDRFYRKITAKNTHVMLLMTWGRKKGIDTTFLGERIRFSNYASMQEAVRQGYEEVGKRYHLPVAPVGLAWKAMQEKHPGITLYQDDGSHPRLTGSYMAALTLYATIFGRSPRDVTWRPSAISRETAAELKDAAALVFTKTLSVSATRGASKTRVKISVQADGLAACREWGLSLECDPALATLVAVQRGKNTLAWPTLTLGAFGGMTRIFGQMGATGTPLSGNRQELCIVTMQLKEGAEQFLVTPRFATEGVMYCLAREGGINTGIRSAAGEWVAYE